MRRGYVPNAAEIGPLLCGVQGDAIQVLGEIGTSATKLSEDAALNCFGWQ